VSARSKARRRALDILFEADVRGDDPEAVLRSHGERRTAMGNPPLNDYTADIVSGVGRHLGEIDDIINATSVGWQVDRMPAVDRAAVRIGVWELVWSRDVPRGAVISEAVAAVKELSTDESPTFVNGLLAKVSERGAG
jgi:N utilization substance protein B